jgi:hypothetical protein
MLMAVAVAAGTDWRGGRRRRSWWSWWRLSECGNRQKRDRGDGNDGFCFHGFVFLKVGAGLAVFIGR